MLTFTVSNSSSEEDLEAFRFVAPWFGKFTSLISTKRPGYPSAETRIEFERVALVLRNLNIGFSGTGPGALEQILVEVGADRTKADKAIQSHKLRFEVQTEDKISFLDQRNIQWRSLGGNLVILKEEPEPVSED